MAALDVDHCSVCHNTGCVYCTGGQDLNESYPEETFVLFTNEDLAQLLVDVSLELSRRDEKITVSVS